MQFQMFRFYSLEILQCPCGQEDEVIFVLMRFFRAPFSSLLLKL
jgi:hypothetical protein